MGIYIIAEIGLNHNGSMDLCKKLIDHAVEANCNAVKFQKRTIDIVYFDDFLRSPRDSPWGTTQKEQKEGLEFGFNEYKEIDRYCRLKGIDWFASAWDIESQMFLRQFDLKFNKVASAMIVDKELLKIIAEERKHTFISTGMSTYEDIEMAISIFNDFKCPFELMHCVSTYPLRDDEANLHLISTLKEKYRCNVGYSGHENGLVISYAAAALGISSLERHITLDRTMYGSDQSASIEPNALRTLVSGVKKIEGALGTGVKSISNKEKIIAEKLRSHIST